MPETTVTVNQEAELQPIVFYCKNCKVLVPAEKKDKTLKFICPTCQQDNIAFGTKRSIENFYHLNK